MDSLLVQNSNLYIATIANGANQTERIGTNGFRGLAIIVPAVWTAANIGFYGVNGADVVPLYDNEGAKVAITGILTSSRALYIAPASIWALGAFPHFIIASLNTGTGALVSQGALRELGVIFLR